MDRLIRTAPILTGIGLASLLLLLFASGCRDDVPGQSMETPSASRPGSAGYTENAENAETASSPSDPSDRGSATRPVSRARSVKRAEGTAPRQPGERPIPAFEGRTVAGTRLAMRELLGSRVLLFLFDPGLDAARAVAEGVDRISGLRGEHNFQIVGVGVRSDSATLSRFVQSGGLDFPVLDDSDGTIAGTLRLRAPVALIGIDAEGYMTFGLGSFPQEGDVAGTVESQLRAGLRLPESAAHMAGELLDHPKAPELGVISMGDGEVLRTAALEGSPAVVIFFLHTCPHCHHALAALEEILAAIPEAQRPPLVAVSIQNDPSSVRRSLTELGLTYFQPYLDPGGQATERFGVTGGVPVVLVLDSRSRIVHRSTGWNEKRDAGILRMKVAAVSGVRVPMLLDATGYSGNDVCGTCHEQEYATWEYTSHASAFDTLVTHAADRRTDCIGCHVVGFEEKGGYAFSGRTPHLENVGCESCHGRGGPHLSPSFVPDEGYAAVCSTCHDATHSLAFEYERFHSRVSHQKIAAMSQAERARLVEEGGPDRNLLPTQAAYVGSDACQSCHAQEYATWRASPHAHAVATLEAKGQADDASCLACHTTAFAKPGGFPSGAPVAEHPDRARVGCESCHGPGADHVGEDARRDGTILSLGDKCDSCVILKICGDCHDEANDPGFRFKVEERIEAQRHGTFEPSATRDAEASADRARLHRIFEGFVRTGEAATVTPERAGVDPHRSTNRSG